MGNLVYNLFYYIPVCCITCCIICLQLSDLIQLTEADVAELLCSAEKMREFLVFPDDFDPADLVSVTCGINTTQLMVEIQEHFAIEKLIEQVHKE